MEFKLFRVSEVEDTSQQATDTLNGISTFCAKRIQMNNCKVPLNPSRKIVELSMLL